MSVFSHEEYAGHENVYFCCDKPSGLKAIIAIHDTCLGPSLGGCRMYPYANDDEALNDVLRLSRGMSFKSAISRLPLGGGKSVIIGDPHQDKTEALLEAMGRAVEQLGGRYIIAEDSGTGVADMRVIHRATEHVAGIVDDDPERDGDPSPSTALGVFVGLREAVRFRFDQEDLHGLKVAIQGLGNVGRRLAWYLHEAGAKVWVSDVYQPAIDAVTAELPVTVVSPDRLMSLDIDVFSPCALGAVLSQHSIPQLKARVVAGAANNQLAHPEDGQRLVDAGILYAPDYVINAGGVIDVYYQVTRQPVETCRQHILGIDDDLREIFQRAAEQGRPTQEVADEIARERFDAAQHPKVDG
jgi:leucine dehydrogenase